MYIDSYNPGKPVSRNSRRMMTICVLLIFAAAAISAQPVMLRPDLEVRTVVSDLNQPISMAFIGPNDFLVLEKASGQVKRVVNGTVQSVVLDLAVNSAS